MVSCVLYKRHSSEYPRRTWNILGEYYCIGFIWIKMYHFSVMIYFCLIGTLCLSLLFIIVLYDICALFGIEFHLSYIGFIWIYLDQNVSFLPTFGTLIFFVKLKNILSFECSTKHTRANIREKRWRVLYWIYLDLFVSKCIVFT